MNDYRYLIDSNALSKLSRQERASEFVIAYCRIPTEVLYEARWFPDWQQLKAIEYPTDPGVLRCLAEVLETVPPHDRSLVDLYANEGNADPLVVACALHATREVQQRLFGETWVIVSNDKAVRAKASYFNIQIRSSEEFFKVLEGLDIEDYSLA